MAHGCSNPFDYPISKKVVEPLGEPQGGITLVMLADKTACVVTNDAARNTPKVTECRFQAVELGFLSLEVIGLGEYVA